MELNAADNEVVFVEKREIFRVCGSFGGLLVLAVWPHERLFPHDAERKSKTWSR